MKTEPLPANDLCMIAARAVLKHLYDRKSLLHNHNPQRIAEIIKEQLQSTLETVGQLPHNAESKPITPGARQYINEPGCVQCVVVTAVRSQTHVDVRPFEPNHKRHRAPVLVPANELYSTEAAARQAATREAAT